MSDEQKMKIISSTFNELYDQNHPLRQKLAGMDEIEEIRIIYPVLNIRKVSSLIFWTEKKYFYCNIINNRKEKCHNMK